MQRTVQLVWGHGFIPFGFARPVLQRQSGGEPSQGKAMHGPGHGPADIAHGFEEAWGTIRK